MKTFLVLSFISVVIVVVITIVARDEENIEDKLNRNKQEILETDKAFSKMSGEKGMAEAFLFYAADDVIKLRDNQLPIMNKKELEEDFKNFPKENAPTLTWTPVKADVSVSGDLGYTFGNWAITGKGENGELRKGFGVYFSIWKRQNDGSWKFVMDGGNSTPPPADLN